jgi:hypothetical protein
VSDPRIAILLRSAAGLTVFAAVVWWLWRSGCVRAERLFGSARGDAPAMAIATWACSIVTLAAMLLAVVGSLRPLPWLALVFAGGVLLRAWRPRTPIVMSGGAGEWGETPPSRLFMLGAAALVLGRLVYGLRNPPADVDSVLYHMPMVAHWAATGGLGAARFEPQQIASYYPGNVEVLSLGFAWLVGRETLMTVPGVLALGLLALALRGLSLEAGARRTVAEALALALACAPGVVQLTLGLRVDNVLAAWFAVALVFALRARRTAARGDVEVALCALGLLAGCKATGPAFAVFVLVAYVAGRSAGARLQAVRSCRFGLATLVLAGGFWMLRNVVASGNPVYPAPVNLGMWALPGLAAHADLATTSQFARWRAGLPGQLTLANEWRFFGPLAPLLLVAAFGGVTTLLRSRREAERRTTLVLLAGVALATLLLTWLQPFSGAIPPEVPGGTYSFSSDNVRYLLPTLVALLPIAAIGLSQLPVAVVVLVVCAAALPGLVPRANHLAPALVVVAVAGLAWSQRWRLPGSNALWNAGAVAAAIAIFAGAVTLVDPLRERAADRAYDATVEQFDGVPSTVARAVCTESAGKPIAVAGAMSVWALYGRDLRGRPEYVPVGSSLSDARSPWRYAPDPRDRADSSLWMRNLRASGAPFIVLVTGARLHPIERTWCERDRAEFTPVYVTARRAVYRIRPPGLEGLTASR